MASSLHFFSLLILYLLGLYIVILIIFLAIRRYDMERRKELAEEHESAPLLVSNAESVSGGGGGSRSILLPLLTRVEDVSDSCWGGDGSRDLFLLFSLEQQLHHQHSNEPHEELENARERVKFLGRWDRGRLILVIWRSACALVLLVVNFVAVHKANPNVFFYFTGWNLWLTFAYFAVSATESSVVYYYLRYLPLWKQRQERQRQREIELRRLDQLHRQEEKAMEVEQGGVGSGAGEGATRSPSRQLILDDDGDDDGAHEIDISSQNHEHEPIAVLHSTGDAIDTTDMEAAVPLPVWSSLMRRSAIASHLLFELSGTMAIFDIICLIFSIGLTHVDSLNGLLIFSFLALLADLCVNKLTVRFDQFPVTVAWLLCYLFFIWPVVILGTLEDWPYAVLAMDKSTCFAHYTAIVVVVFVSFSLWYALDRLKVFVIDRYQSTLDDRTNSLSDALRLAAAEDRADAQAAEDDEVVLTTVVSDKDSSNLDLLINPLNHHSSSFFGNTSTPTSPQLRQLRSRHASGSFSSSGSHHSGYVQTMNNHNTSQSSMNNGGDMNVPPPQAPPVELWNDPQFQNFMFGVHQNVQHQQHMQQLALQQQQWQQQQMHQQQYQEQQWQYQQEQWFQQYLQHAMQYPEAAEGFASPHEYAQRMTHQQAMAHQQQQQQMHMHMHMQPVMMMPPHPAEEWMSPQSQPSQSFYSQSSSPYQDGGGYSAPHSQHIFDPRMSFRSTGTGGGEEQSYETGSPSHLQSMDSLYQNNRNSSNQYAGFNPLTAHQSVAHTQSESANHVESQLPTSQQRGGSLVHRIRAGAAATLDAWIHRRFWHNNNDDNDSQNDSQLDDYSHQSPPIDDHPTQTAYGTSSGPYGNNAYPAHSDSNQQNYSINNSNARNDAYSGSFSRRNGAQTLSNRRRFASRTASAMFGNMDADISMYGMEFDDM